MIPPVSNPEINKIVNFLQIREAETVFEPKVNSPFYTQQMLNLFPGMEKIIYLRFPEDGMHYELKTKNDACILLGNEGCILPKEIRPHFCRIYPFWFFGEEPHIFHDSDCLALRTCETIREVFLSLGTTPDQLMRIHKGIRQDWELFHSMSPVKMKVSL